MKFITFLNFLSFLYIIILFIDFAGIYEPGVSSLKGYNFIKQISNSLLILKHITQPSLVPSSFVSFLSSVSSVLVSVPCISILGYKWYDAFSKWFHDTIHATPNLNLLDLDRVPPSQTNILIVFQGYLLHMCLFVFFCHFFLWNVSSFIQYRSNYKKFSRSSEHSEHLEHLEHLKHSEHSEQDHSVQLEQSSIRNRYNTGFWMGCRNVVSSYFGLLLLFVTVYLFTLFFGATIPYIHTNLLIQTNAEMTEEAIREKGLKLWKEDVFNGLLFSLLLSMLTLLPIYNQEIFQPSNPSSKFKIFNHSEFTSNSNSEPNLDLNSEIVSNINTESKSVDSIVTNITSYEFFYNILDAYRRTLVGFPSCTSLHSKGFTILFVTWLSSILIPLDWEQWFQLYPICSLIGIIVGLIIVLARSFYKTIHHIYYVQNAFVKEKLD